MIESQRHSYHLVDPSPWPISGSLEALATTIGGVMYMHSFQGGATLLSLGLIFILYTMFVWWCDVLCESMLEGHHTKVVQLGPRYRFILFIVSEVMFLFALFWASSHSSLAPTVEIGGIYPPKGIAVLDPQEITFLNTLIPLSSGAVEHHVGFEAAAWDRIDYGRSCSPRNDPKLDLGLFEIVPFNRNQRCFLVSRFFSEQIEEPNGSNSSLAAMKEIGLALRKEHSTLSQVLYDVDEVHTTDQLPLPRYGLDAPPARAGLSDGYDRTIDASLKAGCQESCLYIRRAGMRGTLGQDSVGEPNLSCPVSKKQVTPNPPEGGSKATSEGDWIKGTVDGKGERLGVSCQLLLWGEGPSNSEVGSQYTDTPVIDRDLSLVTGEHSVEKPLWPFSYSTGISLGGTL
ncbi:cytochrome c oxidase subunit 3 [Tanacetum coccineum]